MIELISVWVKVQFKIHASCPYRIGLLLCVILYGYYHSVLCVFVFVLFYFCFVCFVCLLLFFVVLLLLMLFVYFCLFCFVLFFGGWTTGSWSIGEYAWHSGGWQGASKTLGYTVCFQHIKQFAHNWRGLTSLPYIYIYIYICVCVTAYRMIISVTCQISYIIWTYSSCGPCGSSGHESAKYQKEWIYFYLSVSAYDVAYVSEHLQIK